MVRNKGFVIVNMLSILAILLLFVFFQSSFSLAKTIYYQDDIENVKNAQQFYATHSIMTDPGKHSHLYNDLPSEIPELCQIVQGLMIHAFQAPLYGMKLSDQRMKEVSIRKVEGMLDRIIELDDSTLDHPRELKNRLVGNCRDFAVLVCSFFRHMGTPARVRPGFGTYFSPGFYEDHWICEYWNQKQKRWVQVDAQLGKVQMSYHKLSFNPTDLPKGKFLYAGTVYQMCIKGDIDPNKCGIHDMKGLWFVRGNVIRDLMALNKIEVLPWDGTELMDEKKHPHQEISALIEAVIDLTTSEVDRLPEIRKVYQKHQGFRMPSDWEP